MRRSGKPNTAETVEYKGVTFRRYPRSRRWPDRMYFTPSSTHRQRGMGRLHQEIWKDAYGEIPPGHDIHHRDGNPLNNALENLECVARAEHHDYHMSLLSPEARARRREWFHRIRQRASNWHQSEDGREWHRELGALSWEERTYRNYTCVHCGQIFTSRAVDTKSVKFCSNACKSAYRRVQGEDNEVRTCVVCGQPFTTNKYSSGVTCSRPCRVTLRHRRRRETTEQAGGLQPRS